MSVDRVVIAHGGDLSEPSGGTDRISAFASGLQEHGFGVTIVAPTPSSSVSDRLSGIELVSVPIRVRGTLDQPVRGTLIARRAKRVAARRNATLQIEQSVLGGIADLIGCDEFIIDMHDLVFSSPQYGDLWFGRAAQSVIKYIERRGITGATRLIVVSEYMRETVLRKWGVVPEQVTVIRNAYFPERVTPYYSTTTIPGRVAFLGTLHHKLDIDAFLSVAQLDSVKELLIIGDGPLRDEIRSKYAKTDIQNIWFLGRLPDHRAFKLVSSAEVVINPQRESSHQRATCPVKSYYYAALGRPMVVTSGPKEVQMFSDKGAAELVPPDGEFAAAVEELINDDDRQRRMQQNARRAAEHETWSDRVDCLRKIYDS